jgi:NADH-ubiquinone/plastoquinone oxidoreductase, chain 3
MMDTLAQQLLRDRGRRHCGPSGSDTLNPRTGQPYEGGIVCEDSARVRFSARYYLTAAFFVIFDLEAVFLCGSELWRLGSPREQVIARSTSYESGDSALLLLVNE